jgi:hypothetical protein
MIVIVPRGKYDDETTVGTTLRNETARMNFMTVRWWRIILKCFEF